jgi:hypothetical protein
MSQQAFIQHFFTTTCMTLCLVNFGFNAFYSCFSGSLYFGLSICILYILFPGHAYKIYIFFSMCFHPVLETLFDTASSHIYLLPRTTMGNIQT